jgi:sugar phosphate permease
MESRWYGRAVTDTRVEPPAPTRAWPSWWRWMVLAVGLAAQTASCSFLYGIPMLVPALRQDEGLGLGSAGLVVAAPLFGLLLTLIAWGAAADRYGERLVITIGLGACGLLITATSATHSTLWLCVVLALAGACGSSVNAASGRMVLGWFTTNERGLAMGIRQTAQPLGVALAALVLPPAAKHWDVHKALLIPAIACVVAALAVLVLTSDPPRAPRRAGESTGSPYNSPVLWRLHSASALLVIPQFAVSTFTLEYLVRERHWHAAAAGRLVFAMQLAGAIGRIGAGVWSDRAGSRLRPMRQLAAASAVVMLALAVGDATGSVLVIVAFALGAIITVADNGLGYTAAAELAGPHWTGRVLGAQNTGQNITAALTAPLLGALIGHSSYVLGFAVVAVFPLAAIWITPVAAEHRAARAQPVRG